MIFPMRAIRPAGPPHPVDPKPHSNRADDSIQVGAVVAVQEFRRHSGRVVAHTSPTRASERMPAIHSLARRACMASGLAAIWPECVALPNESVIGRLTLVVVSRRVA